MLNSHLHIFHLQADNYYDLERRDIHNNRKRAAAAVATDVPSKMPMVRCSSSKSVGCVQLTFKQKTTYFNIRYNDYDMHDEIAFDVCNSGSDEAFNTYRIVKTIFYRAYNVLIVIAFKCAKKPECSDDLNNVGKKVVIFAINVLGHNYINNNYYAIERLVNASSFAVMFSVPEPDWGKVLWQSTSCLLTNVNNSVKTCCGVFHKKDCNSFRKFCYSCDD